MPRSREDSERRCIVTGETGSPDGLIRFALDPDGIVTPDLSARLPGRGAWVGARRILVEQAASRGMFSRAFKRDAALAGGVSPAGLAELVEQGLRARALAGLGLARRAGRAVLGFDLVETLLREGAVGVALVASDAGADGSGKVRRLAGETPVIDVFASADLSAAFGKQGLVYAAIRAGREAGRVRSETMRLLRYRADETA